MKFKDVIEKNKCTGCMACKNICPKNAIAIEKDENGFEYPKIDKQICINCGICKKVCPVETKLQQNTQDISVYACKNKNEEIRLKSSSGGVFTLIANYILEQNGVVFGACFNENFEVVHDFVEEKTELGKFRGSKYLQSKIKNTYKKVKEFLENDRKVLFTGTPCQVEGLLAFLKKDYDNLYTQDFICHGIPSPKVWKKYLEYKKKINNENPQEINFRRKDILGWNQYQMSFIYSDSEENINHNDDPYMNMFLKDLDLRESCYACNFKKRKRNSDITIADFWGINNVRPEMNDEKGTSAILVNSKKGIELFENIKNDIVFTEEKIEDIEIYNPCFIRSTPYNEKREEFFEDLEKNDFEYLIEKYLKN